MAQLNAMALNSFNKFALFEILLHLGVVNFAAIWLTYPDMNKKMRTKNLKNLAYEKKGQPLIYIR